MAKKSLKERLVQQKSDIKKGGKGNIMFLKEGTKRVRILPVGEENDFGVEVTQFYLGNEIKGVFSPSTFGEPCALMEAYQKLKKSKDDDDQEMAKRLVPKKKFLVPVLVYQDDKGKEVDPDQSGKLLQLTAGMYGEIIDLYLDEDDWGDMTDKVKGYDLKVTREGTTMTNTEYSVTPCKNSPIPKEWRKEVDLVQMVKDIMPTYEETVDFANKFLGGEVGDDDKPEAKKKMASAKEKLSKGKIVKKKRKSDS